MLVVISDLHLTDGSAGSSISVGAFQLLADRLADIAASASLRADGSYRPIDRIELVLLGDTLDLIRSNRWLAAKVRPWDDPQSQPVIDTVATITTELLRRNESSLAVLRSLAEGFIHLAPANRANRPADTDETLPVPVRTHYMVGNHDWFLHLPGPQYDRLRRQVGVALGVSTNPDAPFPHEPSECDELGQTLQRHKVFARHGDIYDPFNYEGHRDASSIGDAIVIELVARFSAEVERSLAPQLPFATLAGLREIDNIRPLLFVPVWIDGLLERTCSAPALRQQVKRIWDNLADNFLSLPFARQRDTWRPRDLVDGLQRVLKFSRKVPLGWASSIAEWTSQIRGAASPSFASHALAEAEFRNRRARHIVYGHTHQTEEVALDASYAEGYVLNQSYFNSGTWRRVYRPTLFAPNEHEFIPTDTVTFLTFFQGDERSGRPYETWTGSLGVNPNEAPLRRIDPAISAQTHVIDSAMAAPIRAPHFDLSRVTTSVTTSDAL